MPASPASIEIMVQNRQTAAAKGAIRDLLKKESKNARLFFQSCEWYRRLGLYRDGYLLVVRELKKRSGQPELLFWCARFLYLLGATPLARSLLDSLTPKSADDFQFLGDLYLADFEHERALPFYQKALSIGAKEESAASGKNRIRTLAIADCLAGMGRFSEAIALAKKVIQISHEPIFSAVALSCEGEYLSRMGRHRQAVEILNRATELFPPGDRTSDKAFCLKWTGWSQFHLGKQKEGRKLLRESETTLKALGLREEAWFDVLRLRYECDDLSAADFERVIHFLGLAPGLKELFRAGRRSPFHKKSAHKSPIAPAKPPKIKVELGSDEYCWRRQWHLGCPLEIRLLAWVALSGEWGIAMVRAAGLLWPEQPYSLLQMENRIQQIMARVKRRYGFRLFVQSGRIYLKTRNPREIEVGIDEGSPLNGSKALLHFPPKRWRSSMI